MPPEPGSDPQRAQPVPLPGEAPPEDMALVAAMLRRDRKAAAEFVARYADPVHAYVRHRLAPRIERVDDVVQDVFLAALSGMESFRGTASLRTWVLAIARHKVEDYYRRRLREPDPLPDLGASAEPVDDGPLVDERFEKARAAERTQQMLTLLPEPYSVALLWRYWENRSVREIAHATGKTEKAIERLLARARARFRQLWNEVTP